MFIFHQFSAGMKVNELVSSCFLKNAIIHSIFDQFQRFLQVFNSIFNFMHFVFSEESSNVTLSVSTGILSLVIIDVFNHIVVQKRNRFFHVSVVPDEFETWNNL